MAIEFLSPLLSSPSGILLAVLVVVALVFVPSVYHTAQQQWAIYTALKRVPCDSDQHWLFGHTPKV